VELSTSSIALIPDLEVTVSLPRLESIRNIPACTDGSRPTRALPRPGPPRATFW
jgi:hypothetical protein